MGISKTEINLMRLLAAAPHQQNQAKLIHYVATLREQLEQLAEEKTSDGLLRLSKAQVIDYSVKIESIAAKLAILVSAMQESLQPLSVSFVEESPSKAGGENPIPTSPGLRRRFVPSSNTEDRTRESVETDQVAPVKLDTVARTHIDKHRKLQDDLMEEMVGFAQQLKESGFMMSQSLKNTETILDSTGKAVEHSLAGTGHANVRVLEIYSKSFKTTCFTWFVIFVMTCIFIMVVLIIRVT
ncbi:hypothetical protein U1Q18_046992 [Sarracenia purpurea var. burkii]